MLDCLEFCPVIETGCWGKAEQKRLENFLRWKFKEKVDWGSQENIKLLYLFVINLYRYVVNHTGGGHCAGPPCISIRTTLKLSRFTFFWSKKWIHKAFWLLLPFSPASTRLSVNLARVLDVADQLVDFLHVWKIEKCWKTQKGKELFQALTRC